MNGHTKAVTWTLMACLLVARTGGAAAADAPATEELQRKAETVLPTASALPGGNYKYPWQVGGDRRKYKTEAEWRKDHPRPVEGYAKAIEQLRQMPREDWEQMRKSMQETDLDTSGLAASVSPIQRAMLDAIAKSGTKKAAIAVLETASRDIVAGDVMEYVRLEKPAAIENDEPDKDPGGAVRVQVELQIWSAESISNRADEIDFSASELDETVARLRTAYDGMMRKLVVEVCRNKEDDLLSANRNGNDERVNEILTVLSSYATLRIDVKGTRPPVGGTSHVIYMSRDSSPGMPGSAQGNAQMRRGVAVVRVVFSALSTYATEFEDELEKILETLSTRAAVFRDAGSDLDLRISSGGASPTYDR